jgi:hypothetical protein
MSDLTVVVVHAVKTSRFNAHTASQEFSRANKSVPSMGPRFSMRAFRPTTFPLRAGASPKTSILEGVSPNDFSLACGRFAHNFNPRGRFAQQLLPRGV